MNIQALQEYNLRWGKLHADILSSLFIKFKENNVFYFILRNFEGLPSHNNSKDVDIIIEPGTYNKASRLLLSVFKEYNLLNYKVVKYERVRCWYGIDLNRNFSIHIDLIEGYLSKGFEVISFNVLYKNTKDYHGFKVLNNAYDAVMLLYYKVIGTKQLKEQYQRKISSIYEQEKSTIHSILYRTLNKTCSDHIIHSLDNLRFNEIIQRADRISLVTKRIAFARHPLKTSINIIYFVAEKFHRVIICPRRYQNFIAVLGADGTGKTTFIEGLKRAIAFSFVSEESKSHIYHFRPTILPNLGEFGEKAGFMKEDRDFTNPHRAKPSGPLSSFFRMIYYWLDYLIGVPWMLRKDVHSDRFTIYDRYIYDFLVDPLRSRIYLPYWIRKLFTKLVIQPRIVFVLLTDAETIYQRKQELTPDEITRQLGEYSKLASSNKRFVVIDASKSPEEMVKQAMHVVLERFTQKLQ